MNEYCSFCLESIKNAECRCLDSMTCEAEVEEYYAVNSISYDDDFTETTKNSCSLQIQRQIEINDNYDMNSNELYIGSVMTLKQFTDKFIRMSKYTKFEKYQYKKILKWFLYTIRKGWFDRFMYRGFVCAVELDDSGKWRVFVKYNNNSQRSIFWKHECNCDQCGHFMDSSSRCYVDGYVLGLWDYGDKLGLDDFIGMRCLVGSEWQYNYFEQSKKQKKISQLRKRNMSNGDWYDCSLFNIDYAKKMCKLLVDKFIIQLEKEEIQLGGGEIAI